MHCMLRQCRMDISEQSRKKWEAYSGISDERWPEDMYTIVQTKNGYQEKPGRYFNVSKGYGFIKDLSGTEKYFFHVSNALSELVENAIVIFDLERGKRGMNAINICISERTAD